MTRLVFFPILAAAITISFFLPVSNRKDEEKPAAAKGFAVVELFTSEGCSSCPPADEAVMQIAKEFPENVYILGFHVDYWNYIGWTDEFSNADFTARQQLYASHFDLSSIYTPQIIVNGEKEFVGSEKSLLRTTVQEKLDEETSNIIKLNAKNTTGNNITVSYQVEMNGKNLLNIALVQLHATTSVKRGENEGRRLNHINVVKEFKTIAINNNAEASVSFKIPAGLSAKDIKLIAFLQRKADWKISGAAETIVQ